MPSDEKLARVCRDARLTFAYLITQADDDGLVQAAPRQLLGMLFPHDADVTESMVVMWCDQLTSIGAARWRQTRGGTPVLELVNWSEHQKIKHRAKPILLPTLTPYTDADSVTRPASPVPPSPHGSIEGVPPEDRGRGSPTNQQPATVDHGPTTDHGPATNSEQAPGAVRVSEADGTHRASLAAAANTGIKALYGEQPLPLRWDHPGAFVLAQRLEAAGVDLDFARRALFTLASTKRTADGKPPRTLKYFADALCDAWSGEVQRRHDVGVDAPDAIALGRPGHPAEMTAEQAETDMLRRIHAGEFAYD